MKQFLRDYPVAAILLLLLACIRFEYHAATWSIRTQGLLGGLVVLAIVGIVLLFRIFNSIQDICISQGLLESRLRYKYDILIPIAIIAVSIHGDWGYWRSELAEGADPVPRWSFGWSDPYWAVPFLATLIGVVLLVRVFQLLRAIADRPNEREIQKAIEERNRERERALYQDC